MPKRTDINSILIIGAGPIIIGQACEFDYSGTQAAKALKEEGIRFSSYRPRSGQELYYVGSPAGIYHPPVAPILTGIYSGQIDASNSLISIPAIGGSSGSAVMDLNNRMVGVLWAAHNFQNVSIMTNWDASAIFLYEVSKMYGDSSVGPNPLQLKK